MHHAPVVLLEVLQDSGGQLGVGRLHLVVRGHVAIVDVDPSLAGPLDIVDDLLVLWHGRGIEEHPALWEEERDLQPHLPALVGVEPQKLVEAEVAVAVGQEVRGRGVEELPQHPEPRTEVKVLERELVGHLQETSAAAFGLHALAPVDAEIRLVHARALAAPQELLNLRVFERQVPVAQPLVVLAVGAGHRDKDGHAVKRGVCAHGAHVLCHALTVPDVIVVAKDHPDRVPGPGCWLGEQARPQRLLGQGQGGLQMLELRVFLMLPHRHHAHA
mmetsp:Transcript_110527/g.356764  ORF Transcript_110527/g.356764 Transcript_110527/m.356764 type:complete len:273 (-) Transcript_110527:2532-3350(-)